MLISMITFIVVSLLTPARTGAAGR
jgi:hypothetical protein